MAPPIADYEVVDHQFKHVFRLTRLNQHTEYIYKIYNVTVGWISHDACEAAMIDRAYHVWNAIKDSMTAPCYFTCVHTYYAAPHNLMSMAVMINCENIDDYETALTMIKLSGLERTRMHF
jgi:hypothetical protein